MSAAAERWSAAECGTCTSPAGAQLRLREYFAGCRFVLLLLLLLLLLLAAEGYSTFVRWCSHSAEAKGAISRQTEGDQTKYQ
jgi:hypothetical protein